MERAPGICERAHDLAVSIDPDGIGQRGARDINRGEGKCENVRRSEQKSDGERANKERPDHPEAKTLILDHSRREEGQSGDGEC